MKNLLSRYLRFGTAGRPQSEHRRIMALNLVVGMTILTGASYGTFCVLYDFDGLWAQAATYAVAMVILAATFPLQLLNPQFAAYWWSILISLVLFWIAYLTGRDAGFHLYLLSGPGIILTLFGVERLWQCIGLSVLMMMLVLIAGSSFTEPAPFMRVDEALETGFFVLSVSGTIVFGFLPVFDALSRVVRAETQLAAEHARSEALLYNLLPSDIAARLKVEPDQTIADSLPKVAILFADIVDFTPRASKLPPEAVVGFLNTIFRAFDELAEKHGLEKIKTIGDAYMVAAGIPNPVGDPVHRVAEMALDMQRAVEEMAPKFPEGLEVRIGLHAGPAVAGVIGNRKLFYDVWGETVNTASRMESHGEPGRIQVTTAAKEELEGDYEFEPRGTVEVKGMGKVETWFLAGSKA